MHYEYRFILALPDKSYSYTEQSLAGTAHFKSVKGKAISKDQGEQKAIESLPPN